MKTVYPANLVPQDDSNILVTFPDVPEALTEGSTWEEAVREAVDSLIAALGGYILAERDLPSPYDPEPGQISIYLPPRVAAKTVLYRTLRSVRLSLRDLADRLKIDDADAARLLDLDLSSRSKLVSRSWANDWSLDVADAA